MLRIYADNTKQETPRMYVRLLDTGFTSQFELVDASNRPMDLTGASGVLVSEMPVSETETTSVTHPVRIEESIINYDWQGDEFLEAGLGFVTIKMELADGQLVTLPRQGYILAIVQ